MGIDLNSSHIKKKGSEREAVGGRRAGGAAEGSSGQVLDFSKERIGVELAGSTYEVLIRDEESGRGEERAT